MLAGVDGSSVVSCLRTSTEGCAGRDWHCSGPYPALERNLQLFASSVLFIGFFNEQSALLESLGEIDCSSVGEGGLHLSAHF